MIAPPRNTSNMPTQDGFAELVKRANAGEDDALAELRHVLDANPEIWRRVGDLATHAQLSLVKLIAGGNRLVSESLLRKAAEMKAELSGPSASKMEELAVERVVACWLEMEYLAATYPVANGETLGHARFVLRQREGAERRFQAAMKSLTTLRALLPGSDANRSGQVQEREDTCRERHAKGTKNRSQRGHGTGATCYSGDPNNRLRAYLEDAEPIHV